MRLSALRKEIAAGIEQVDQGQFVDGPEAFARIRERSTR
jgi:predicted transcriptional regulator